MPATIDSKLKKKTNPLKMTFDDDDYGDGDDDDASVDSDLCRGNCGFSENVDRLNFVYDE